MAQGHSLGGTFSPAGEHLVSNMYSHGASIDYPYEWSEVNNSFHHFTIANSAHDHPEGPHVNQPTNGYAPPAPPYAPQLFHHPPNQIQYSYGNKTPTEYQHQHTQTDQNPENVPNSNWNLYSFPSRSNALCSNDNSYRDVLTLNQYSNNPPVRSRSDPSFAPTVQQLNTPCYSPLDALGSSSQPLPSRSPHHLSKADGKVDHEDSCSVERIRLATRTPPPTAAFLHQPEPTYLITPMISEFLHGTSSVPQLPYTEISPHFQANNFVKASLGQASSSSELAIISSDDLIPKKPTPKKARTLSANKTRSPKRNALKVSSETCPATISAPSTPDFTRPLTPEYVPRKSLSYGALDQLIDFESPHLTMYPRSTESAFLKRRLRIVKRRDQRSRYPDPDPAEKPLTSRQQQAKNRPRDRGKFTAQTHPTSDL